MNLSVRYFQDLEEFMKEVQEARRIKMLHQPSKVHFVLVLIFFGLESHRRLPGTT